MNKFIILLLLALLIRVNAADAQTEKHFLKHQIATLAGNTMHGRGYVNKGREHASKYIQQKFKEFGLEAVTLDSSLVQSYTFPVNTFPGSVSLNINKNELVPGEDFLIDAASPSFVAEHLKIKKIDLNKINDSSDWNKMLASRQTDKVYFLENMDSVCKRLQIKPSHFAAQLPNGCFIIPQHGKLTWTVATDTIRATVFYVEDTILPRWKKHASVNVKAEYISSAKNENIIACAPGEVKDSFIVFTAHYDHLGMMGKQAVFPGASDNASGTAMLLYLANYFAAHPQHFTIVFIAFSGEEAGLKGSEYFVSHPLIPLNHIKFLTNIDIMGDATDGITAVNATEYPNEFDLMQQINTKNKYLPAIKSRGETANSDHYYFYKAGVPSFFIYSNGGKGYYHDIFDIPKSLSLEHIDGVAKLLIDFATQL